MNAILTPFEIHLTPSASERRTVTLLAVDDDAGDLLLLRRHLEEISDWRVQLLAFQTWETARGELQTPKVDALLLDLHLGSLSGIELIRMLRSGGEQRPIILLTGQGDEAVATEAMRSGADDYVNKRWLNPDALRRAIGGAMDRSRMRREMALLAAELRQSQRMEAVATLAGGLAHDFNNLLTGAMGYLEMALVKGPNQEVVHDLMCVRGICAQMAETVKHLLAFGRGTRLDFTEVQLQSFLEDFRSVLVHTLPKGVQLRWDVEKDPILIHAAPVQLHQVLMAIARNGAEAMEGAGALTVRARKVVVASAFAERHPGLSAGDHALMEIEDTGHGMDADTLRRIFDPFFTTKGLDSSKGRGASLALAWQAIRAHRGTVLVESEPGRGARFSIYLPTKPMLAEMVPPGSGRVELPRGSESLLLVDDEASLVEVAQRLLQRLGYRVFTAMDGIEALQLFEDRQGQIDLVILDLSMPRMDGRECFRQLRIRDPHLPIVFASGHDMTCMAPELLAMGAQGVLQKPFILRDLALGVRTALDKVRLWGPG
jgi:two-component system cell cycle sensor histidine kinase/response regulator CckA